MIKNGLTPKEELELIAAYDKITKQNKLLLDYFQWSSAASDFQKGGIAYKGFMKYKKLITSP